MKKRKFIDHSKKAVIHPNVWGPINLLQGREHLTVLYLLLILNPKRTYKFSICKSTFLEPKGVTGGWRLLHAENIHIVKNNFDDDCTVVSGKSLHRCTLYFPELPRDIGNFSLVEYRMDKEGFHKTGLWKPRNGMLWLEFDFDDSEY